MYDFVSAARALNDVAGSERPPAQRHVVVWNYGRSRAKLLAVACSTMTICAACDRSIVASPHAIKATNNYVTGAAALALNPAGDFVLPDSVMHPLGMLAEPEARRAAVQYASNVSRWLAGSWSPVVGYVIEGQKLEACGSGYYASSAYDSLAGDVSEFTRRVFGPHWIVPICDRQQLVLVVSLSARATELRDPKIAPSSEQSFLAVPIGANIASQAPFTPERAVALAYSVTGKRISSIPRLIMPRRPQSPITAHWLVTLDGAVTARGKNSGVERTMQKMWVGFDRTAFAMGVLDIDPSRSTSNSGSLNDPRTKKPFTASPSLDGGLFLELLVPEGKP